MVSGAAVGADWLFGEAGADQASRREQAMTGSVVAQVGMSSGWAPAVTCCRAAESRRVSHLLPGNEPEAFASGFRAGADTLNLSNIVASIGATG